MKDQCIAFSALPERERLGSVRPHGLSIFTISDASLFCFTPLYMQMIDGHRPSECIVWNEGSCGWRIRGWSWWSRHVDWWSMKVHREAAAGEWGCTNGWFFIYHADLNSLSADEVGNIDDLWGHVNDDLVISDGWCCFCMCGMIWRLKLFDYTFSVLLINWGTTIIIYPHLLTDFI